MKKNMLIISVCSLLILNSCKEKLSFEQLNGEWKAIKFEVIDKKNVLNKEIIEHGRIASLARTIIFNEDSTYNEFIWKNKVNTVNMKYFGKFEIKKTKKLLYLHIDTLKAEKKDGSWKIAENKGPYTDWYTTRAYKIIKINEDEMIISEREHQNTELIYIYTLKKIKPLFIE